MEEPAEAIGARIRRLREERGLSQRALAGPGVGYAYISRIERGDRVPSMKALRRLAPQLGVTVEYLETGTDLAGSEVRELQLGEAELALRLEGDLERASDLFEGALAAALASGDLRDAARARIGLGIVASHRGDHQRAIELLVPVTAAPGIAPETQPVAFVTLAHCYVCAGRLTEAVELLRGALDELIARETVDRVAVVRFATNLSYALGDAGDLAGAREALDRALGYAAGVDDVYTRVRLLWSSARLSSMDGDYDRARAGIARAIALLETTEDTMHLGRAHLLAAELATVENDLADASDHLASAETLVGAKGELIDRAWLRVQQAFVLAHDGDGSAAIDAASEAIDLISRTDADMLRGVGEWALGEAFAAAGAEGAARKAFRDAARQIEPHSRYGPRFLEAWAQRYPADVPR